MNDHGKREARPRWRAAVAASTALALVLAVCSGDDTTPAPDLADESVRSTEASGDGDTELLPPFFDPASTLSGIPAIVSGADGFAALGQGLDGPAIETSTDGIGWSTEAATGLDETALPRSIAHHDGTSVGVVTAGELDEIDATVAVSEDLRTWTVFELAADDERALQPTSPPVLGPGGFAVLARERIELVEPVDTLDEFGVLDGEALCGLDIDGPDEPIRVLTCDRFALDDRHDEFTRAMEAATDPEALAAVEIEFADLLLDGGRVELAVIEPGTALHDELLASSRDRFGQDVLYAVSGAPEGPHTVTELPTPGFGNLLVATPTGFVAGVGGFVDGRSELTVLASTDGVGWERRAVLDDVGPQDLIVVGDRLVLLGADAEGFAVVLESTDGGAAWTPVDLTSPLHGVSLQARSGPAGTAILVTGAVTPWPEFDSPAVEVRAGRFTLRIDNDADEDWLVLTGVDGSVIHTVRWDDLAPAERVAGASEVSGVLDGTTAGVMTFLDPTTGVPLVTFTPEMIDRAWRTVEPPAVDFSEPELAREAFLTGDDGRTWASIDVSAAFGEGHNHDHDTSLELAALGDDELLLFEANHSGDGGGAWIRVPLG